MADSGNSEPSAIRQREKFDVRCQWDGKHETYHVIRRTIEAYLIMNDMDYLIDPTFVKAYTESGWDAAKQHAPTITTEQFKHDRKKLYGIWKQATRDVSLLQRFFSPLKETSDGVKLTQSIHQEFRRDHDILSAIADVDFTIEEPYDDQLDVVQFVKDFVEAIAERNDIIDQHRDEDHGFVPTSDFEAIHLIRTKLQTATDEVISNIVYDLSQEALAHDWCLPQFVEEFWWKEEYVCHRSYEKSLQHDVTPLSSFQGRNRFSTDD